MSVVDERVTTASAAQTLAAQRGGRVDEQDDARIRPDEDISGMWIGVKEAVNQKLVAVKLDQVLNHLLNVDVMPDDLIDLRNAKPS